MIRYTTDQVPHIWAQQQERRLTVSGISFEGPTLFSYSTPIASFARDKKGDPLRIAREVTWHSTGRIGANGEWVEGPVRSESRTLPVVLVNRHTFSITTSRHQSGMLGALGHGADRTAHVFTVDAAVPGYYGLSRAPFAFKEFHAHNLADYVARIIEADAAAKKARLPERAASQQALAQSLIHEAEAYAKAFKVKWVWAGADKARARIEADARKSAKLAAQAAERARLQRIEDERIRREHDAEDFAAWLKGEGSRCPQSYMRDPTSGGVYLRHRADDLETSMGAVVPWSHALKVFQFIKRVRETGQEFKANGRVIRVGHYHVDSIDAAGNMKAGCHYFAWAQIEDLARREGVLDFEPSAEVVETNPSAAH